MGLITISTAEIFSDVKNRNCYHILNVNSILFPQNVGLCFVMGSSKFLLYFYMFCQIVLMSKGISWLKGNRKTKYNF